MTELLTDECALELSKAFRRMLAEVTDPVEDKEHIAGTPARVVKAYGELLSGVRQDPTTVLACSFSDSTCNEMVTVESIDFISVCIHHLLPFFGQAFFAYIPNGKIVGLSKIPRMIDILARRPQIQERLTNQIADVFMSTVQPLGCGVMMRAWHGCVACRGVQKPNVRMRTTALRGLFLDKPGVKEEFLTGIYHCQ